MPKVIVLSGHIGFEVSASFIRRELAAAKGQPVRIDLSSPGGFVFEGIEIFNLIREYKGETEIRLMSLAASMGSYIALAGDKVTAFDNATFMIHNALSFAFGNHNDMRKTANKLEGISNLVAKEYVKKSGKSVAEIKKMMDDDTYLFGDEILDAGFIDEIIKSDPKDKNKKDKDSAIIEARLMVEGCFNKMRESEAAKADLEKAAAYLDTETLKNMAKIPVLDKKENHKREVKNMTLKQFLEENPSARIEFDKAISDAQAEGAKKKKEEMQVHLDKVSVIIASDVYPNAIRALASEVLQGTEDYSALKGAVTMFDASEEKRKSDEATAEAAKLKDTKPGPGGSGASEDGSVENEDNYQAEIERSKKELT